MSFNANLRRVQTISNIFALDFFPAQHEFPVCCNLYNKAGEALVSQCFVLHSQARLAPQCSAFTMCILGIHEVLFNNPEDGARRIIEYIHQ